MAYNQADQMTLLTKNYLQQNPAKARLAQFLLTTQKIPSLKSVEAGPECQRRKTNPPDYLVVFWQTIFTSLRSFTDPAERLRLQWIAQVHKNIASTDWEFVSGGDKEYEKDMQRKMYESAIVEYHKQLEALGLF